MVEQLICNQRVGGSTPSVGSSNIKELWKNIHSSFSFCCSLPALKTKNISFLGYNKSHG
jgi:hypothetical protein